MLKNKEIQELRVKGYFIQAAKEMLKGEGLRSVSVRNISERAGYSYGTLYNYFKDIQELIFVCVKDFQDECEESVMQDSAGMEPGIERIKVRIRAYLKYFIQYPGIFELFFLERMTDIQVKQPISSLIYSFLDRLCLEDWEICISRDRYQPEQAGYLKSQLNYLAAGLLLYYLNRSQPVAYDEFWKTAVNQIDRLLE